MCAVREREKAVAPGNDHDEALLVRTLRVGRINGQAHAEHKSSTQYTSANGCNEANNRSLHDGKQDILKCGTQSNRTECRAASVQETRELHNCSSSVETPEVNEKQK